MSESESRDIRGLYELELEFISTQQRELADRVAHLHSLVRELPDASEERHFGLSFLETEPGRYSATVDSGWFLAQENWGWSDRREAKAFVQSFFESMGFRVISVEGSDWRANTRERTFFVTAEPPEPPSG